MVSQEDGLILLQLSTEVCSDFSLSTLQERDRERAALTSATECLKAQTCLLHSPPCSHRSHTSSVPRATEQ